MLRLTKLCLGAMMIALSQASIGSDEITDELARCSAMEESLSRLACYDTLSGRSDSNSDALGAIVAVEGTTAGVAATTESPADSGAESSNDNDKAKNDDGIVVSRVTSCIKDVRKKYIFYLDSGQVWKQVNDKRLTYKECDFMVTIKKDFFGYKMQIEGEKFKIRISRVR